MPIQVDFGEELGRIEFPDEMSEEQVKDAVRKNRAKYRAALLGANQQLNERETAEQIKSGEIPVTVGERIGSIAASLVQGAAEGVASVPEFISKAAERLNQKLPLGEQVPAEEMTTGKLATSIRERANRWAEQIPGIEEEFWSGDVPRGLGQIGAMLTAGGAGSILGKAAARAAVTTAAFTAEAQDAFNRELSRQSQTGETEDKDQAMRRALVYATGATAIENWIGAGRMLRKYQKLFGKTPDEAAASMVREGIPMGPIRAFLGKTIKETGVGAVEEGLQRGLQDLIIDRKLDPDAILREAAVGGVVQGIASAPANVLEARGQAPAAPGQQQAPPPSSTTPQTDATLESEFDQAIQTATPEPGTLIRPDLQAQVGTPPNIVGALETESTRPPRADLFAETPEESAALEAAAQRPPAPSMALVPAAPTAEIVAPGSEEEQAAKFREVMAGIDAEIAAKTGPAPTLPTMPERIESIDDLMAFRERRKGAEIEFLKSLGLDENKARKVWRAYDDRSQLDVSGIVEALPIEQQQRLDAFERQGDAYIWDRKYDLGLLATDTDVADVAASLVANIADGFPTDLGDKFLHAAVALRRIKELGGTWQDVAKALDGITTRKSGSQSDKEFAFREWGTELKRFAQQQGIELPLEPAAVPARPVTPPALAAAARQAEQAGAPLTAQAVVSTAAPAPKAETLGYLGQAATALADNLYAQLWERARQGKTTMAGLQDPVLVRAKPLVSSGEIQSAQDLRNWVAAGERPDWKNPNKPPANALPIQSPSPSLPRQEGPEVVVREMVSGNRQPQETSATGQEAQAKLIEGGEQPNAQKERFEEGVQQVAPAPTAPAPATTGAGEVTPKTSRAERAQKLTEKLESMKRKQGGETLSALFPGLDPATINAIINTALDLAIKAIKAGTRIADAVEEQIKNLRYQGYTDGKMDEAGVRALLTDTLRRIYGEPAAKPEPAARSGEMKETQGRRAAPPESGIPGAGLYPGYSEEKARQEAADFISGLSNEDAFRKVMDPLDPVDPVLKPYIFTAIVDRIKTEYDALGDPKDGTADAVQKNKLRELMFTVEDAGQKAGSVSGQNLQAQQGAVRGKEGLINWLRTMNVWRDKRNERLKKEGVPTEAAEPAKKKARKTALEKLESDEGLLSFIKRFLKTENINLRELFRDLPETRKERIAEIVRRLLADPMFSTLSVEDRKKIGVRIEETFQRLQKEELEKALKAALEGRSKKVKDAVEDAMPELVRQMNLGMLTDEKFRELVAEKLGIPQLTEDQAKRLEKLGEQVQKEKVQAERNRLMYKMVELLAESGVSWGDIANDSWFANVLSSPRTIIDVLSGGTGQLIGVTFRAALDAAVLQRRPDVAARMIAQAIGDYARGLANGVDVLATGDYSRIPGYEKKLKDILAGKIRPDSLELLRKNPKFLKKAYGQLSYVRRFMVAADYAGALGVRNVGLLYAALSRGETEQLNALMKKLQKAEKNAALEQAKKDLGPGAKMVDVWARQQEIIEGEISDSIRESSERLSSMVALTAEPTGLLGAIYKAVNSIPEPYRGPLKKLTGTTFFRSAANMVNMALEWMPLSGLVNPIRAIPYWQTLPENSFLRKFALDLPPEQRRLMFFAQALTYPLTLLLWNAFDDDDDDEFGIEGNWFGVSPEKKKQLINNGAKQLSIRIGKNYYSFKNTPIAAPLAFIANMQDQKKYNKDKWDEKSAGEKLLNGWLMGMMYVKDLAPVSQLANLFGQLNTAQMPEAESFMKRMAASVGSTLGGYIPLVSLQRDIDSILDPKIYKPNGGFEAWVRNVPYLRRTVGQGPDLNMIGQEIQAPRYPWGRWVSSSPDDPVIEVIGRKAAQGVFVPMPQKIDVFDPRTRQKREQTDAEFYRYTKEVLQGYGKWFRNRENLRRFDRAKPTEAAEILDRELSQIREAARARARQRALSASAR